MDWFYAKDGRQFGPVSEEKLSRMFQWGELRHDSLVWHEGMADWQPYRQAAGMPDSTDAHVEYGGFWIRFWAYLIDGTIIGLIRTVILAPMGLRFIGTPFSWWTLKDIGEMQLISLGLTLLYFGYFWTKHGATPGKMVFGLKVVTPSGGVITASQAVGRYFAMLLSGLILGIGFIMAGFDEQKRSLHDRLAETRVVRERR